MMMNALFSGQVRAMSSVAQRSARAEVPMTYYLSLADKPAAASQPAASRSAEQARPEPEFAKVTFNLGGNFTTRMRKPKAAQGAASEPKSSTRGDPFDGVPFRSLAEFLGESYLKTMEEAEPAEQARSARGRRAPPPNLAPRVPVPSFLPMTKLFSATNAFESTFVADDDVSKRRTRLSWYHPDDTMVPRGWLGDGLLADLKWYRPFRDGNGWAK